jgi:hypothetical protein
VFGDVGLAQSVKGLAARGREAIPGQGVGIAAHVFETLVVSAEIMQ